jgi:hypothetical protein
MMHTKRVFQVHDVATKEGLAEKLVGHTWVLCQGFRHGGFLWLNDATSEDGAFEVAVVREADMKQVETITFGWMETAVEGLKYIDGVLAGEGVDWLGTVPRDRIRTPAEHGRCGHCA